MHVIDCKKILYPMFSSLLSFLKLYVYYSVLKHQTSPLLSLFLSFKVIQLCLGLDKYAIFLFKVLSIPYCFGKSNAWGPCNSRFRRYAYTNRMMKLDRRAGCSLLLIFCLFISIRLVSKIWVSWFHFLSLTISCLWEIEKGKGNLFLFLVLFLIT